MKNTFFAAIAAVLAISCTKKHIDHASESSASGTIKVEMPQVKTVFGEEENGLMPVLWSYGDKIKVYDGESTGIYKLINGAGTSFAEFEYLSGDELTHMTKIVYPAEYNAANLKWQLYYENTIDPRGCLLEWEGDSYVSEAIILSHKNSIVCVRLSGDEKVNVSGIKVSLTNENGTKDYNIQPKVNNVVAPINFADSPIPFYIVTEPALNASAKLVVTTNAASTALSTLESSANRDYTAGTMRRYSMPLPIKVNLTGSSTDWGWTVDDKGLFAVKDGSSYTWTGDLKKGYFKLYGGTTETQIRWDKTVQTEAPMGEVATWDACTYIYNYVTPADNSFTTPEAGRYTIEYDVINNKIKVQYLGMRSDATLDNDGLYLYGPFGWSLTDAVAMTSEDGDSYTYTGDLAKDKMFKFLCKAGAWYPSFVKSAVGPDNKILYRASASSPAADKSWTITEDGNYTITVKLSDLSIDIHKNL